NRSRKKYLCLLFVYYGINAALRVHGPSDPPVAQLGGSVLLPCFIESSLPLEDLQVEWRKMDAGSVVSLFQQGKSRPDLQTQVFRDRAGFFPDEVSKGNFSILLKNVVKEDAGVYRC
ncbi:butyrophilin-like protein 2, partial [Silurus meridionalis]